jgi:phosphatidylethanolamine/phosphatidyl-N-methylethanolamine N-methyltransferase
MSLRRSYTLIAPLYDALLSKAGTGLRAESLGQLPQQGNLNILISGIGTGLDLPYLPQSHHYTGLDLTAGMLKRVKLRVGRLHVNLVQGNSMVLPFANESFDHAVLHLILAIVRIHMPVCGRRRGC